MNFVRVIGAIRLELNVHRVERARLTPPARPSTLAKLPDFDADTDVTTCPVHPIAWSRSDVSLDFDELVEVNRLRIVARVVSNAAHDINNALQVIGGSAEMLGMRSTLGPAEQRRVQVIAAQAERIAATLACLSSITR
jgi:signal transduction histidine kinase